MDKGLLYYNIMRMHNTVGKSRIVSFSAYKFTLLIIDFLFCYIRLLLLLLALSSNMYKRLPFLVKH